MKKLIILLVLVSLLLPVTVSAHTDPNDPNGAHHAGASGSATDAEVSIEEDVVQENPLPHLSQITIYMIIGLAGIAAGSIGTFLLLTTTLHPKR